MGKSRPRSISFSANQIREVGSSQSLSDRNGGMYVKPMKGPLFDKKTLFDAEVKGNSEKAEV